MSDVVSTVLSVPGKVLSNFVTVRYSLVMIIGVLVLVALIASRPTASLNQRAVKAIKKPLAQKPIVPVKPVAQPKAYIPKAVLPAKVVPKITKVSAPVMNPKSILAPASAAQVEQKVEPPKVAKEEVLPKLENTVENTFEAYRQAMLSSGPRQMEEEARQELQSKTGSSAWREQTASLRSTLRDESAASFLERTNTSINDRMVAIFDAVKA